MNIDFSKCGACMCKNCKVCNDFKKNEIEMMECFKKNIEDEKCRKEQKENRLIELELKNEYLQSELNKMKIMIFSIIQQLNNKALGIKI